MYASFFPSSLKLSVNINPKIRLHVWNKWKCTGHCLIYQNYQWIIIVACFFNVFLFQQNIHFTLFLIPSSDSILFWKNMRNKKSTNSGLSRSLLQYGPDCHHYHTMLVYGPDWYNIMTLKCLLLWGSTCYYH